MLTPLSWLLRMATFASGTCPYPRYFYGAYVISNITPASFIKLTIGTACRLFLCHYLRGLLFLVEFGAVHFSLLRDVGQALSPYGYVGSYACAALVRALALQESRESCGSCSHFKFLCGHLPAPDDLSPSSLCVGLSPRQMSWHSSSLPAPRAHSGRVLVLGPLKL